MALKVPYRAGRGGPPGGPKIATGRVVNVHGISEVHCCIRGFVLLCATAFLTQFWARPRWIARSNENGTHQEGQQGGAQLLGERRLEQDVAFHPRGLAGDLPSYLHAIRRARSLYRLCNGNDELSEHVRETCAALFLVV